MFLGSIYILPARFRAKMATLHFGQNSWTDRHRGIFIQNLLKVFFIFFFIIIFFFNRFFFLFLWPIYMLATCSHAKMVTLLFGPNSWPIWHKGIFLQNLEVLFLYFFPNEFSICFLDLYICYLQVFLQKRWYCRKTDTPW